MSKLNRIMNSLRQTLKTYGYNAAQARAKDGKWTSGHDQAAFHLNEAEGLKNGNAKRRHIATALAAKATQVIKDGGDASGQIAQLGSVVEALRLQVHHAKTGKKATSQAQIDERQAAYDHYRGLLNQVKAHAAGKGPPADVAHFKGALDDAEGKVKGAPPKKVAPVAPAQPVTPPAPPTPVPVSPPTPAAPVAPAPAKTPDFGGNTVAMSKKSSADFLQQHTTQALRGDEAGADHAMHLSMGHHWAAVAQQAMQDGKLDKAAGAVKMMGQHSSAADQYGGPDADTLSDTALTLAGTLNKMNKAANPAPVAPVAPVAPPAPVPVSPGTGINHAAEATKAEALWNKTINDSTPGGADTHWASINNDSAHGALAEAAAGQDVKGNLKDAHKHLNQAAEHIMQMKPGGHPDQNEAALSFIKAHAGYSDLAQTNGLLPGASYKIEQASLHAAGLLNEKFAPAPTPAEPAPIDMTSDEHFGKSNELQNQADKLTKGSPTADVLAKQALLHMKLGQIKNNAANGIHNANNFNLKVANDLSDELQNSAPDSVALPLKHAVDTLTAQHAAITSASTPPAPQHVAATTPAQVDIASAMHPLQAYLDSGKTPTDLTPEEHRAISGNLHDMKDDLSKTHGFGAYKQAEDAADMHDFLASSKAKLALGNPAMAQHYLDQAKQHTLLNAVVSGPYGAGMVDAVTHQQGEIDKVVPPTPAPTPQPILNPHQLTNDESNAIGMSAVNMTPAQHALAASAYQKMANEMNDAGASSIAAAKQKTSDMHMMLGMVKQNMQDGKFATAATNISTANDMAKNLSGSNGTHLDLAAGLDALNKQLPAQATQPATTPAPAGKGKWQGWGRYGALTASDHNDLTNENISKGAGLASGNPNQKIHAAAAAIHFKMTDALNAEKNGGDVTAALKGAKTAFNNAKSDAEDAGATPDALGHLKLAAGAYNAFVDAHPNAGVPKIFMGDKVLNASAHQHMSVTPVSAGLSAPAQATGPVDHLAEHNAMMGLYNSGSDPLSENAAYYTGKAHNALNFQQKGTVNNGQYVQGEMDDAAGGINSMPSDAPDAKQIADSYLKAKQGYESMQATHGLPPLDATHDQAATKAQLISIMTPAKAPASVPFTPAANSYDKAAHTAAAALAGQLQNSSSVTAEASEVGQKLKWHHEDQADGKTGPGAIDWLKNVAHLAPLAADSNPHAGTLYTNAVDDMKATGQNVAPETQAAYDHIMNGTVPGSNGIDHQAAKDAANQIGFDQSQNKSVLDAASYISQYHTDQINGQGNNAKWLDTAAPTMPSAIVHNSKIGKMFTDAVDHLKSTGAPISPSVSAAYQTVKSKANQPVAPTAFTPTTTVTPPVSTASTPNPGAFTLGAPKADDGKSSVPGFGKLPKEPDSFNAGYNGSSAKQHYSFYKKASKADPKLATVHQALYDAYNSEGSSYKSSNDTMALVAKAKAALAQYGNPKGAGVTHALHSIDHFEKKYGVIKMPGIRGAAPVKGANVSSVPGAGKLPAAGGTFKPLSSNAMANYHAKQYGPAQNAQMSDLAKAHGKIKELYQKKGYGGQIKLNPSVAAPLLADAKAHLAQHIADHGLKGPGISNALLSVDHLEKELATQGASVSPTAAATPNAANQAAVKAAATPFSPITPGTNHTSISANQVKYKTANFGTQTIDISTGAGPAQTGPGGISPIIVPAGGAKTVVAPAVASVGQGQKGTILGKTGAAAIPIKPVDPATLPKLVHTAPLKKLGQIDTTDLNVAKFGPGKKLGGSNGAALYTGSDGVERVVKTAPDSAQVYGEHVTNKIYSALGIPVPKTSIADDGSRLHHISEFEAGTKPVGPAPTPEQSHEILKGFAADVLLGNRDAVGLNGDNIHFKPDGTAIRLDNGGSLLHQATGPKKPVNQLTDLSELTKFKTHNNDYSKVFQAAGVDSYKDIPGLPDQIRRAASALSDTAIDGLVTKMPHVAEADRQQIITMLKSRRDQLVAQIPDIEKHQAATAGTKALKYAAQKKTYDEAMALVASGQNPSDSFKTKLDTGAHIIHQLAATGQLPHHKDAKAYVDSQGGIAQANAEGKPDISNGAALKASLSVISHKHQADPGLSDSQADTAASYAATTKNATITHMTQQKFKNFVTLGKSQTCFHGVPSGGHDNNNLQARANVESGATQLWNPHDGADRSPIYGEYAPAIDHTPPPPFKLTHSGSMYSGYSGGVAIELHPHVKERTQFYGGDSLGLKQDKSGKINHNIMNTDQADAVKAAYAAKGSSISMESIVGGGVTMEDVRAIRLPTDNVAAAQSAANDLRAHLDGAGYHHVPIYIHQTGVAGGDVLHYHSGTPM
jgi:hypothetical protein